jgi:hypothetical protein
MIDKQLRWGMLEENASISIRRQCKILWPIQEAKATVVSSRKGVGK